MSTNINEVVTDRIKNISEPVFNQVVETIVSREADKRADAIVKVMGKIEDMQKENRRFKPDVGPFYDDDGNEIEGSARWSKAKLEERKKLRERIAKAQKAVEEALNGNMEQVYKLAQGN